MTLCSYLVLDFNIISRRHPITTSSFGLRFHLACVSVTIRNSKNEKINTNDLSIFYRYVHGHCSQEIMDIIPVLLKRVRTTRSSTHSHTFQVSLPTSRTLSHKSFVPRTRNLWNVLPPSCLLNLTTCYLSNLRSINLI